MLSGSKKIAIIIGLLAVTLLLLTGGGTSLLPDRSGEILAQSQGPTSTEVGLANCRYNVAAMDAASQNKIPELGAGAYLNFIGRPQQKELANGAEYIHMIEVGQDKREDGTYLPSYHTRPALDASYANYIRSNPGGKYIAGNETDRVGQDGTYPEVYAAAYHEIYHFIKSIDPTAQVAITGLVQVTPNRLQYLDKVWRSYIEQFGTYMPVDIWTMHLYVLPEVRWDGGEWVPNNIASTALGTDAILGRRESQGDAAACSDPNVYCFAEHDDLKAFAEQVVAMRTWMKNHGQQRKPLLLTEYSILYPFEDDGDTCFIQDEFGNCFTPDRVKKFMTATFDYLNSAKDPAIGNPLDNNRLIQQWTWFSVYFDAEGSVSNLVQPDLSTNTALGNTFKNYVASQSLYRNLIVDNVADVAVATNGAPTAEAKLSVSFRNNGNAAVNAPVTVSFFKNANYTEIIGSVIIDPALYGCSSQAYTAEVTWSGLKKGTHKYYVYVDSAKIIPESPAHDGDNVGQGTVTVYANQINLPVIRGAK